MKALGSSRPEDASASTLASHASAHYSVARQTQTNSSGASCSLQHRVELFSPSYDTCPYGHLHHVTSTPFHALPTRAALIVNVTPSSTFHHNLDPFQELQARKTALSARVCSILAQLNLRVISLAALMCRDKYSPPCWGTVYQRWLDLSRACGGQMRPRRGPWRHAFLWYLMIFFAF